MQEMIIQLKDECLKLDKKYSSVLLYCVLTGCGRLKHAAVYDYLKKKMMII